MAAGNPLPLAQHAVPRVGHAFEARIYAENPRNGFLPDSGHVLYLSTPTPTHIFAPPVPPVVPAALPAGAPSTSTFADSPAAPAVAASTPAAPVVRVEQGVAAGSQIGVFYDPMIAKLVVHAASRPAALRALRAALAEYRVAGVSTNVEFLRTLAGHPAFVKGEVDTGFIEVRISFRERETES